MEDRENIAPEISAELAASLFEPVLKEGEDAGGEEKAYAPAPTEAKKDGEEEVPEVTPELILKHVTSLDENGHSPSVIVAVLEKLHNLKEDTYLEDIPEEDREYVDNMVIEGAAVDIYTLDGHLYNLILRFDSVNDAFLRELNEICNRYRAMREGMAENGAEEDSLAFMAVTIMPDALKGFGALNLTFPVGYFRILDDYGVNACMLLQFMDENVQFQALDMSSEMQSELTADVLREMEEGRNGSIYE